MLWKESLRVGVDSIDEQHMELFRRTDELMKEMYILGEEHKQKCIATVRFLKDYAVRHFSDEEAYQKSIGYKGFEAHKKLHEKFVQTVLEHEKKMTESDFASKDVKQFVGMLVAWLLYHISDADQKYVKEKEPEQPEAARGHGNIVCGSIADVLNKMAGLDPNLMKKVGTHNETFGETFVIEVEFTGDISGYIALVYPVEFVRNFIYAMMSFTPDVIDDLEISALFEVSNIISGTICRQITKEKGVFCDIGVPIMTKRLPIKPKERVALDTGKGIIEVDMEIIYK